MQLRYRGIIFETPIQVPSRLQLEAKNRDKLIYRGIPFEYSPHKLDLKSNLDYSIMPLVYRGISYNQKLRSIQKAASKIATHGSENDLALSF